MHNIKKSIGNSFRLNINHHTDIKNPHYTVDVEQTSSVFFAVYTGMVLEGIRILLIIQKLISVITMMEVEFYNH